MKTFNKIMELNIPYHLKADIAFRYAINRCKNTDKVFIKETAKLDESFCWHETFEGFYYWYTLNCIINGYNFGLDELQRIYETKQFVK